MATYLALLRGVNLGATNKVSMGRLRELLDGLGYDNVRTYVQSGNVIFGSTQPRRKLAGEIQKKISGEFGLDIAVILRTRAELTRVVAGNPFPTKGTKSTSLHVVFLDSRPAQAAVRVLDPDRGSPDRFDVKGREIYLWFPKGSGRTKLTIPFFEKTLKTRATGRNWRTVTTLLRMMEE